MRQSTGLHLQHHTRRQQPLPPYSEACRRPPIRTTHPPPVYHGPKHRSEEEQRHGATGSLKRRLHRRHPALNLFGVGKRECDAGYEQEEREYAIVEPQSVSGNMLELETEPRILQTEHRKKRPTDARHRVGQEYEKHVESPEHIQRLQSSF